MYYKSPELVRANCQAIGSSPSGRGLAGLPVPTPEAVLRLAGQRFHCTTSRGEIENGPPFRIMDNRYITVRNRKQHTVEVSLMNEWTKMDWEQHIVSQFSESADFTISTLSVHNEPRIAYYFKSLVDLTETLQTIEPGLDALTPSDSSSAELIELMLAGSMIIRRPDVTEPFVYKPKSVKLNRQVSDPVSEHPLQLARDSFTEDLYTNVGLLRRKLIRKDLVIESFLTGTSTKRELAILYIRGEAVDSVVEFLMRRLRNHTAKEIHNITDLLNMLGQPRFSLVPTYTTTELPGETAQNLQEGKVIVLLDQFPFALAFPAIIKDLWSLKSDMNYPSLYRIFYRVIRVAGIFLTTVTPGLYVVLNAVNPELLRIQLAVSVAKSREGVPYPAIVEVVLMLLLLEMVIEATVRLPKSIGPTITMIGGIILGQAIVQAHLVSNLLIIVLATSTIANFTMAGYINTIGIRIFKYATLLLSTMFGIFGLEAAIVWLCIYLSGLNSSSFPYMSLRLKGHPSHD